MQEIEVGREAFEQMEKKCESRMNWKDWGKVIWGVIISPAWNVTVELAVRCLIAGLLIKYYEPNFFTIMVFVYWACLPFIRGIRRAMVKYGR